MYKKYNSLYSLLGFDALGYQEHLDYGLVQSTNPEFNKATVRVNVFRDHRQTIQVCNSVNKHCDFYIHKYFQKYIHLLFTIYLICNRIFGFPSIFSQYYELIFFFFFFLYSIYIQQIPTS